MPYIAYNGQLYEVTQSQYNSYTAGSPLPAGAVLTSAANVASGGTATENNTATTPILTENTTNNTPGQTLTTTAVTVKTTATTTTSDATVNAQTAATTGLTADQLTLLGAADVTDPYIRARLGLPALSEVQTLSGAIGNVNFGNVGNAVGNLVTSFGNTVGNISLGDIGNVAGNVASSFGNAVGNVSDLFSGVGNTIGDAATAFGNSVSNIGDLFSGNTATTVADSAVNTVNTTTIDQLASGQITADQAFVNFAEAQATGTDSTTVSTDTADAGSGTTVGNATDTVSDSQVDTAPADVNADINPQVAIAVDNIPPSLDNQVDAPADVNSAVDPQASLAPGEEIVPNDQVNASPADLDALAASQGVAGEEGNITGDTLARDPGSFTADELNAIADAQGVAGEGDASLPTETTTTADDPYAAQDQENGANAGTGTGSTNTGEGTSADNANGLSNIQGLVRNAQNQQTIADQRKQINNGDWRVRLRLAPQADYLYRAKSPGIMQPLAVTDGIIFPYTPQIDTSYRANYESYDLTHSNYRGYFYKNSYVDSISLKAQFTAQDTNDANYLLAVITFLKSATKMFYGQDSQRGAPPPLVYLSGFGDYQFREHACVISQFQYNLPDNVDYIRAGSPNSVGLNLTSIRDRQSVATNSIFGTINRLAAAFLPKGGQMGTIAAPTLGLNRPTYVPTKIDINLTLLPMQSRQQVSKQFSVKEFSNGNLIKGGFW